MQNIKKIIMISIAFISIVLLSSYTIINSKPLSTASLGNTVPKIYESESSKSQSGVDYISNNESTNVMSESSNQSVVGGEKNVNEVKVDNPYASDTNNDVVLNDKVSSDTESVVTSKDKLSAETKKSAATSSTSNSATTSEGPVANKPSSLIVNNAEKAPVKSQSSAAHSNEPNVAVTTPTSSVISTSSKKVLAFATYYYSGDQSSYKSLTTNYKSIDELTTHTYIMDKSGNITGLLPKAQIDFAKSKGIKTYAMVSNNFNGNIAKAVLESSVNRKTLVTNIINALKTNGYKGVNIDIEGVFSSNRAHLTEFMGELYSVLKPLGYSIAISVPAKTYDKPSLSWNGAYDYVALGRYADEVVLMTYDEHYQGGAPGAVASIGWVKNVVSYALTTMPKEKIILGVAAYGYDWSSKGTKALSISQVYSIASKYSAAIKWDNTSQTPYFNYIDENGTSHSVWFENSYSLAFKLDLVNSKNISGIAIWRIGLEDASYWNTINSKFK